MFLFSLSRMRPWLAAAAVAAATAPAFAAPPRTVPDTMAQRMLVCTDRKSVV